MKIIAFYSPKSGIGKSTTCQMLSEEFGYTRLSFADSVREDIDRVLSSVPDLPALLQLKAQKTHKIPNCNSSYVELLIEYGTNFVRKHVHEDYWVWRMEEKIKTFPEGTVVVIDDLRFPNEHFFLNKLGALTIRLNSSKGRGEVRGADGLLNNFTLKANLDTDDRKFQYELTSLVHSYVYGEI